LCGADPERSAKSHKKKQKDWCAIAAMSDEKFPNKVGRLSYDTDVTQTRRCSHLVSCNPDSACIDAVMSDAVPALRTPSLTDTDSVMLIQDEEVVGVMSQLVLSSAQLIHRPLTPQSNSGGGRGIDTLEDTLDDMDSFGGKSRERKLEPHFPNFTLSSRFHYQSPLLSERPPEIRAKVFVFYHKKKISAKIE
jgi:hypothetical protein